MQATFRRARTGDRGPPGEETMTVDILTTEQLGPKMSMLPNGSLLCRDVPIARVGWMIYGPGETLVQVGDHGVAYVERTADELFAPETIGSFMAATVTDNHPSDHVVPDNWKTLAKGFSTNNVRRGKGADSDVLLADLVITDRALISQVLAGKREVSCGYEADYFQTGPGLGRQTNILGNHIALVEKGRCGPRCAIGDRAPPSTKEGTNMTDKTKQARRALTDDPVIVTARQKAADAIAELEELEQKQTAAQVQNDGAVHVHIHQGAAEATPPAQKAALTADAARIDKIEAGLSELTSTVKELVTKVTAAPSAALTAEQTAALTADAATAAAINAAKAADDGDSKALADSYTKVIAQAEVLVPGFRVPTFDAAAKRKVTVDQMCQARKRCLGMVHATVDGQAMLEGISGEALDIDKMDCAAAAVLFGAAAALKAANNNRSATGDSGRLPVKEVTAKAVAHATPASVNKDNAAFWQAQEKLNQSTPA